MRILPDEGAGDGCDGRVLGFEGERAARWWMGALVAGDRWVCAADDGAADGGVAAAGVGADDVEVAGLAASDSLVKAFAGGSDGRTGSAAAEGAVGCAGSVVRLVGGSGGVGHADGVAAFVDAAGLVGLWVRGAPRPSLRVEFGAECTVRRELTSGERWAGPALGAALLDATTGSGLLVGAAVVGSVLVGREPVAGTGVWSRSIRPTGAAPSVRAERWAAGTTVMAARGLGPAMGVGPARLGVGRATAWLGTLASGSGEAEAGSGVVSGQLEALSSPSPGGVRRWRRAIPAERP